ncbi:di-heme oxidoredictase family protein [Paraflavitalea pollutisoli]|uniref:di-heme oxidoredictase family protein n=1 Tax=Paraflavitalea pollutisoli TaxID=3034143 RepID=UPI0023ECA995|nr:di-heme oxidoredictase family protein [Paraflavitalea sp. H1-2-19X]
MRSQYWMLFTLCSMIIACSKLLPAAPAEDQILDGPVEGLSAEQSIIFLRGDAAFNNDVFTQQTGLGPLFVATSCGSCHAGDGKGHPFSTLVRFGQRDTTGNTFLGAGGPQLQHRALPGYVPELIPSGASFSTFMPPANTGLGYLDAVSDAFILSLADPEDKDGDGISGRPNYIVPASYSQLRAGSIVANGKYIGRFGKKAAVYDLLQQTAGAYNQDMGISSVFEGVDTYSGLLVDQEVSTATIHDVVFYLKTLKAPIERNTGDPVAKAGKVLFNSIGCAKCHLPDMQTGISSIESLSNKRFHPYTDLLLHDMGSGLDDGYTEGTALTAEWRTPPLWGLGLAKKSQGGRYFLLHDGRAKSIEDAITWHDGEAKKSKERYDQLNVEDKNRLLKFLESL